MPRFETPRLQMAVFQMVITVASGLDGNNSDLDEN